MKLKYFVSLIFIVLNFHVFAQSLIKGTIVDEKQKPISQASILIDKTDFGTSSNAEGKFEISLEPHKKNVIIIRAVGYQPLKKEISATDFAQPLQIQLIEDHLNLNEVVVSATRNRVNRREAPVIVNVLSPKLFNATQSVAMSETLNYQPGVRLETNCQNCGFTQVRLNGLEGAYSQILINSRSIFSALNSVYGLDQIPTSMIDRIEVVRSGGSALFGANAIAGTINIITKDPIENDWSIKSTNSLIGGRAWDNTVDFNTSIVDEDLMSGVTFYGMNRNRQAFDANKDGFTEITKLRNTTFGAKAFYKTNENNKITVDFSTLHEFRRGGDQLEKAPHFTDITEQIETNSFIGGVTYDHYFDNFNQKLSLYSSIQKSNRDSYYGGLGGERTLADSLTAANAYGTTTDLSTSSGLQYTYNFPTDVLTVGAEFTTNKTLDKIPGYARIIDQKTKNIGSYAQYEWKPTAALKTLIGARYDYSIIDGQYALGTLQRSSDLNFGTFSPRLTILYDILENFQFRGGYARGFRAPQAFNEDMHVSSVGGQQVFVLMGEGLKTEYSNAYTGSLNFNKNFGSTQTSLLVEGFYTELQNPFTNVYSSEEDGLLIQEMRNGENGYVYGTNIELNIAPSAALSFQAGGTIQRSKYKEAQIVFENDNPEATVASKTMLRSPNTYGFLNTNWKVSSSISTDITGVYTGSMIAPHIIDGEMMNLVHTPKFFELNFRLGKTFTVKKDYFIEVSAGIQNMFNAYQKDFDIGATRDSDYIYGPSRPRTYTFGIKIGHFH